METSLAQDTRLSLSNRATHLCKNVAWLTPKTRSSPHMLRRRIQSSL